MNNFFKYNEHEILKFGEYYWIVLKIYNQENQALLLMKDILSEKMKYNMRWEDTSWEKCSLRQYLNTVFYNSFNSEERNRIVSSTISNLPNKKYNTSGGNDTSDKIFLLSTDEVDLLWDNERSVMNWWWLRSPGHLSDCAAGVYYNGVTGFFGDRVSDDSGGVRPALRIKLL